MFKLLDIPETQYSTYIKSPINYIGNKSKLISQIVSLFPKDINWFVDVFGGSGTVLINTKANTYVYNDINNYVGEIFRGMIESESAEDIIKRVESVISEYSLSMTNKEGFEKLRDDYNSGRKDWITLYTLMCHSFNHQFRFNNNHEYNGSFGMNRSYFSDRQKADLIALKKRKYDCKFYSERFQDLFTHLTLFDNDLVYFDPPYLGSVGNYNDGNRGFENWTDKHEIDLLNIIDNLNNQNVKFALSNNLKYDNQILKDWLDKNNYHINYLDGDYVNCNYHKIDRSKDIEVLITNY